MAEGGARKAALAEAVARDATAEELEAMTDSCKAELAHNSKHLLIALDQAANAAMGFVAALVALWPRCRKAGFSTAGAGTYTVCTAGHAAWWMAWRSASAIKTTAWKSSVEPCPCLTL
ncbi:hypothetical protein IG626_01995 [Desulfovibrio desulfuricans]|uniref:hypothetical protein n=1 Tax=Desulfovibrio desulfuricans TaxID=876 RepID=UPI00177E90CF|nr:hypothetical protein [Desulfovibrio desulfuricans]MBD8894761.1 hypothetical protein [Desulfovibrio desulfuricans]